MSGEDRNVDLRGDGLLWLINATVFHPRGFALAQSVSTGALSLLGDGREPWRFGDDALTDEKFQAAEALFARIRELPSEATP